MILINVWLNTDTPVPQGHRSLHVWLCTIHISCISTVLFLLLFVCMCFVNKATRLINKMVITFKDFTAQVRSIKLGVYSYCVHLVIYSYCVVYSYCVRLAIYSYCVFGCLYCVFSCSYRVHLAVYSYCVFSCLFILCAFACLFILFIYLCLFILCHPFTLLQHQTPPPNIHVALTSNTTTQRSHCSDIKQHQHSGCSDIKHHHPTFTLL